MTEEEQVAYAMQLSMDETGKGKAPAEKNKKEGDSPREAHEGGNNVPGPQSDQGEVPNVDPDAGVVEEPSEGTQEYPPSPGGVLPKDL